MKTQELTKIAKNLSSVMKRNECNIAMNAIHIDIHRGGINNAYIEDGVTEITLDVLKDGYGVILNEVLFRNKNNNACAKFLQENGQKLVDDIKAKYFS